MVQKYVRTEEQANRPNKTNRGSAEDGTSSYLCPMGLRVLLSPRGWQGFRVFGFLDPKPYNLENRKSVQPTRCRGPFDRAIVLLI